MTRKSEVTQLTSRLRFMAAAAILLAACSPEIDLTGPYEITLVRVFVKNDTAAPFNLGMTVVSPGQIAFQMSHTPAGTNPDTPFGRSFDISRDGAALARISYRVLKYEEDVIRDVTISITEPTPGELAATTRDTAWITIVGVQRL